MYCLRETTLRVWWERKHELKLLSRHPFLCLQACLIHSSRSLYVHRDCRYCLETVSSPHPLKAGLNKRSLTVVDRARQSAEPVFSVADELAFHSFRSVFETGLDDPALLNAVMLTFAFAVTEGSIDRECLGYQSQAMSYIRQRLSSLDRATSASTIGAILLLAGVEVWLICFLFQLSQA